MTRTGKKIGIIGGGIMGLACGWYLARANYDVTIYERDAAPRSASWAAGGMLAPDIETEANEQVLSKLLFRARDLWPQFARDLLAATNIDVAHRDNGSMLLARDNDDVERLKFFHSLQRDYGLAPQFLSGYEARKIEPRLAASVVAALFHPHDARVDNRACVRALQSAFIAAGGIMRTGAIVDRIMVAQSRVAGVVANGETVNCDIVINCAGAWSGQIIGQPDDCTPPVRPVKGQMIAVQMDANTRLIDHLIWSPDIYLIPQPGRLLIGATVEEMGFNTDITAGGQMKLLAEAYRILPGIYDLPIMESWAGLRPTSRDDAPILGPTAIDGLLMATGHHRNGILLAPLTADAIFQLIDRQIWDVAVQPFAIQRFAAKNYKFILSSSRVALGSPSTRPVGYSG